jgi:hypothetical protein
MTRKCGATGHEPKYMSFCEKKDHKTQGFFEIYSQNKYMEVVFQIMYHCS